MSLTVSIGDEGSAAGGLVLQVVGIVRQSHGGVMTRLLWEAPGSNADSFEA